MSRYVIVLVLLGACSQPALTDSTTTQDSRWGFVKMLSGAIGIGPALSLYGYGCYCGPGNDVDVLPVDRVDECCMAHDYRWIGATKNLVGCDCNNAPYDYTTNGGAITCTPGQSECAMYCCEADREFTTCISNAPPQNPANRNYDRSTCEPMQCMNDDDCGPGEYCDAARCVPYCGGADLTSAAANLAL